MQHVSTSRHEILPQDRHHRFHKQPLQIRLQRHGHSMSLYRSLLVRLLSARASSDVHAPKGSLAGPRKVSSPPELTECRVQGDWANRNNPAMQRGSWR